MLPDGVRFFSDCRRWTGGRFEEAGCVGVCRTSEAFCVVDAPRAGVVDAESDPSVRCAAVRRTAALGGMVVHSSGQARPASRRVRRGGGGSVERVSAAHRIASQNWMYVTGDWYLI